MAKQPESASSEPFVSQQDRPNIHGDTPLSELRVRDLQAILAHKTFDKFKEVDKHLHKEVLDKHFEKVHTEADIAKVVKDARDTILPPFDPHSINQIVQSLTGLQSMYNQLANEVQQLKAKAAKG